ncbi:MAG: hypothetical protein AVDCRST_MAG66-2878, partial [uncultured Pseudonocardia sp.]
GARLARHRGTGPVGVVQAPRSAGSRGRPRDLLPALRRDGQRVPTAGVGARRGAAGRRGAVPGSPGPARRSPAARPARAGRSHRGGAAPAGGAVGLPGAQHGRDHGVRGGSAPRSRRPHSAAGVRSTRAVSPACHDEPPAGRRGAGRAGDPARRHGGRSVRARGDALAAAAGHPRRLPRQRDLPSPRGPAAAMHRDRARRGAGPGHVVGRPASVVGPHHGRLPRGDLSRRPLLHPRPLARDRRVGPLGRARQAGSTTV